MVDGLAVVIAAAGTGSRMKTPVNKQYILLRSRPVLAYSLEIFEHLDIVKEVVVVAHPEEIDHCQNELVNKFSYRKVSGVVAGGATRQDSVWQGLLQIKADTAMVAVHDGARPLLTAELVRDLYATAEKWQAAIPAVAVQDTLKTIDEDCFTLKTLDRSRIVAIQTPQVFRLEALRTAYQKARQDRYEATDDAALFEKYIGRVKVVPGDYHNLKITTPEDILIAESFLNNMER